MKRFMMICAAVGLLAGGVIADPVSSVNVVGFNRVTLSPGMYHLVSINFLGMDETNTTLLGILGTNTLRAGTNPNTTDNIWMWDTASQKYIKYFMYTNGTYRYATNSATVVNPPIEPGDAVWLKTPSGLPTNVITLLGQVVAVQTQIVDLITGYNMVSYGFSSDTLLGDLAIRTNMGAIANGNPTKADQIWLWTADGQKYTKLFLKTNGWFYATNSALSASNLMIRMGDGFWYLGKTNYSWTETNKYINSL